MSGINIYHLYPEQLNLYGDRGNILALIQRARWHGLEPGLFPVRPGYRADFRRCDLLFVGGGQDAEQKMVFQDFYNLRREIADFIEQGMVLLAICGSYQLLGHYYETASGERIPGLSLLDLHTTAGRQRMTGDLVVRCTALSPPGTLVGFENHGGRTFLGPGLKPLGEVIKGFGNNGKDRTEGVAYKNLIGTYLHGALLPKNPWLTDHLLRQALRYRGENRRLGHLDDTLENLAHNYIVRRNLSPLFRARASAYYQPKCGNLFF